MARIYQRTGQKGPIWYVDYLVEGRRVRQKCGQTKRMAELALADIKVKLERKELGFERKDRSLDTFLGEYLKFAKANKADKTFEHFERLILADRLTAITPPKLEAYKTKRKEEGAKSSTVNRELNTIKAMLRKAVEWGYLAENPAQGVKKFKEQQRQVRYLTTAEIRKLLEAATGRLKLIVATLLYTGLRRDELIHLAWKDVDLDKKIISVQPKAGWHPKDYEVRHIPMSDTLRHILEAAKGSGD